MDQSERVLACVDELIGLDDPSQLPMALAGPLHDLIPYDFLVYNEIDTDTGAILTVSEPSGVESGNAAFEEYAYQHPLIAHYQRTRDPSVLRLSDHISQSDFHRLELYNDFLRTFGIEHQIVCTVPAVRTVAIGLVLTRERRDFTAAECGLLATLRPHVLRAYRSARRHSEIQRRLHAMHAALAASGHAAIVLDASSQVETASANAEEILSAYGCGPPTTLGRQLADGDTVSVSRNGGRLTITRAGAALLLDEKFDPFTPARLRSLGLTSREADVLRSVADGASNKAIAGELGTSLRTVKKHLERIYEKLGVDSRTEAVAIAQKRQPN